jgi:hypothetical protein
MRIQRFDKLRARSIFDVKTNVNEGSETDSSLNCEPNPNNGILKTSVNRVFR